jgi:hypothetical protein
MSASKLRYEIPQGDHQIVFPESTFGTFRHFMLFDGRNNTYRECFKPK